MTQPLAAVIARHIDAVNSGDLDSLASTFAPDAYVNDNRREIRGAVAIRAWLVREIIGDHVAMDVREIAQHHGDTIVRAAYTGSFDTAKLPPGDLILTNYFRVCDGLIVSLVIVFNQPSPYAER